MTNKKRHRARSRVTKNPPTGKFSDFIRELAAESRREGPEAIAEAKAFRTHFQLDRQRIQRRLRASRARARR